MPRDELIARLARQIDAARKTEQFTVNPGDTAALRARGAVELHALCAEFVESVNSRLTEGSIDLSPVDYIPEMFRETGVNLFQVAAQGREMQLAFQAPRELVSTEKFLVPYVLEGEIRSYNQQMLERFEIRTQLLFYCVENGAAQWRYSDLRNFHTGLLTRDVLAGLMERLF
jgi:hypothetical protein